MPTDKCNFIAYYKVYLNVSIFLEFILMLKKILVAGCIVVATFSAITFAIDSQKMVTAKAPATVQKLDNETLSVMKAKLEASLGLSITQLLETPLDGIMLLITERGTFYVSQDGKFVIQGKIFDLSGEQAVDVADSALAQIRIDGMERFQNDMIVYPAKDEKHVITVFTDITCGYCRKMHQQIEAYNDLGITVRYLAYPRHGIKDRAGELSQGFKDLRSIWCNENPAQALTKAKDGSTVALRICDKPIEEEFNFGRQIGVNGTPAIILADGQMLPGYQTPDKLSEILESL